MPAHRDLSGSIFHGVRVICVSHKDRRSEYHYACLCHCGKTFIVSGDKLKRGHTRSCGCIQQALEHGKVSTAEYGIWAAMKRRCMNKNDAAYPSYGGRGISVCDRWMDFKNFIADMGQRPSATHSIDRKDNNGNYEPTNCRWASKQEQATNRRNVTSFTMGDRSMSLTEWANSLGTNRSTLEQRLKKGWSVEKALSTPVRKLRARN